MLPTLPKAPASCFCVPGAWRCLLKSGLPHIESPFLRRGYQSVGSCRICEHDRIEEIHVPVSKLSPAPNVAWWPPAVKHLASAFSPQNPFTQPWTPQTAHTDFPHFTPWAPGYPMSTSRSRYLSEVSIHRGKRAPVLVMRCFSRAACCHSRRPGPLPFLTLGTPLLRCSYYAACVRLVPT